jgi:ribosomal-protein-alanine N-acetyltransferase
MSAVVRTLEPPNGKEAALLHGRCFDQVGERAWSAAEIAQLLEAPGCFGLMLLVDGAPAGLAMVRVAGDEAEILTLGVVPEARRRGGATRLLAILLRHCHDRGVRRIFLEVAEDNVAARRLYEVHGFVAVGRREAYFDRGAHGRVAAIIMRLERHASA